LFFTFLPRYTVGRPKDQPHRNILRTRGHVGPEERSSFRSSPPKFLNKTTSSFLFANIKIWDRINCGMVKIIKRTLIADLITPFNSLHKVFEFLLLILSQGTTWWRIMPPYGTSTAENLSRPRTFPLYLPEGSKCAESTRFVLSHIAGSPLPQGNTYCMR
jgi:hypothetical protein